MSTETNDPIAHYDAVSNIYFRALAQLFQREADGQDRVAIGVWVVGELNRASELRLDALERNAFGMSYTDWTNEDDKVPADV